MYRFESLPLRTFIAAGYLKQELAAIFYETG